MDIAAPVMENLTESGKRESRPMGQNLPQSDCDRKKITQALKDRQFIPYFQPQYHYIRHEMFGVEVLARWKTPDGQLIPPYKFIPVLEETGEITALDLLIFEKAAIQISEWKKKCAVLPVFSFNLSRFTVLDEQLIDRIKAITDRYELESGMIHFEITESAYIENYQQMLTAIEHLKSHGFKVEMDDFGSGYSSLSFLRDAPMDVLKMDMSFLRMNANRGKGGSIISSVTRLAANLDMDVIAEGVETFEQAEFLKSVGCYLMQGYYFSKPVPADEFYDLLLNEKTHEQQESVFHDVANAVDFLDDTTQSALLFNSFVGGACLIEYDGENETSIFRTNDRFYRELGVDQADFPSTRLQAIRLHDHESRVAFKAAMDRAIETGQESEADVCFLKENSGREIWLHVRVRCLAKKGENYLLYVLIENITARKELDGKNRMLQQEISAILKNVPGGFASFRIEDHQLVPIYITPEFADMTGYTVEEMRHLLNGNVSKLVHPDDYKKCSDVLDQTNTSKWKLLHVRVRAKDGGWKRIAVQNSILNTNDDLFLYMYCWDETDQINQTAYQTIINETETAVVVTNLETHEILFVNDKAAAIGKTTVEDAIGQRCYECLNKCSTISEECLKKIPPEGIDIIEERYGKKYNVRRRLIDWNGIRAGVCYISDKEIGKEAGEEKPAQESIVASPRLPGIKEIEADNLRLKFQKAGRNRLQKWRNVISTIKTQKEDYADLLTDEKMRKRIQFVAIYVILGTVSVGMTVMNYFTGWYSLGMVTAAFSLCMLVNVLLSIMSEKMEALSWRLFAVEFIAMFAAFAIVGEPEGFSILWAVLVPTCGMLLYQIKYGTIISLVELFALIILFWTPWGRSLLQYEYTQSFEQRFPVLYLSLFFVGLFLEFIRYTTQRELTQARERFEYMYNHDALTGLYNRYGFNNSFKGMFIDQKVKDYAFSISDLDDFKQINDKYGHMNGDVVLKTTAKLIRETVGDKGFVSRWGGEEFAILFYNKNEAYEICRTINQKCGQITYPFNEQGVHITISVGLVLVENGTEDSISEVITAADTNLYHSKQNGKNQITQSKMIF